MKPSFISKKLIGRFAVFLAMHATMTLHAQTSFSADPCGEMDLNKSEPLKSMPILDQEDQAGICYAETAAEQLEFQMNPPGPDGKLTGPLKTVSGVDLAFLFKKKANSTDIDGGKSEVAVGIAFNQGVVTRECVDDTIKKITSDSDITEEEFVDAINYNNDTMRFNDNHKYSECIYNDTISYLVKSGLLDDTAVAILDKVLYTCQQTRKPLACASCNKGNFKFENHLDKIPQQIQNSLDNGKPATLDLCAGILQGDLSSVYSTDKDAICFQHSVMAVGRRKNGNQCEYLIRNSWGGTWNEKTLTCACETPVAYYQDCRDVKTDDERSKAVMVGCWVPTDKLLANTFDTSGFIK